MAGNAACTVITAQFARTLGILNEIGGPTQAHGGTVRAQGIVPGATVDLPVINIEYHIKGDPLVLVLPITSSCSYALGAMHASSHRLMHSVFFGDAMTLKWQVLL